MRVLLSTSFYVLILSVCFSQKALRDSLTNRIEQHGKLDSTYIDLLNTLSFEYVKSDPSQSLPYINTAIEQAERINYQEGLIHATTNKGSSFWVLGLHDQALSYYLLALTMDAHQYPLSYARLNNNIGEVFKKKKLYDSSMKYYTIAWETLTEIEDIKPSILASNIAEVMLAQSLIDSAEYYYRIGLRHAMEGNNKRGLAYAYFGLAEVNFHKNKIDDALSYQQESLNLWESIEDHRGRAQSFLKIGTYYLSKNQFELGMDYINKAENLAKQIGAFDLLLESYEMKFGYYSESKRYQRATEYHVLYGNLKDSIRSEEFNSSLDKIKSALLTEISIKENQLLKQNQLTSDRVNQSRLFVVIIFSILVILSIAFYYQYREKIRLLKHQKEKDQLIKQLTIRNKNLEEFNSVISHNLREPLTQIIGYSRFFEKGESNLSPEEIIGHIKQSSFKIDQTIRELSTVLNEKEPKSEDLKPVNIQDLIGDVIEGFKHQMEEIGPLVEIDVATDLNVKSYTPFLRDILYHLISNAFKFRCDTRLEISIRAWLENDRLLLVVTDNGLGFDMKRAESKLFKMYQRFHAETEGRGVGLYIVKNRVDSLNGEITVKSSPGSGSTFTVSLPAN